MKQKEKKLLFLFAIISGILISSCNRYEHDYLEPQISQKELSKFDPEMRSNMEYVTTSIPTFRSYLGNELKFRANANPDVFANEQIVYVQFTAPTGQKVQVPMEHVHTSSDGRMRFELYRTMQLTGRYYVEFGMMDEGEFMKFSSEEVYPSTNYHPFHVLPRKVAIGNDYNRYNDSGYADNNCTSWVAWKINQMWNTHNEFYGRANGNSLGDATDWKNKLQDKGYTANLKPQVGDIAWWKRTNSTNGHRGHVAFVNEVLDNGNTVTVTEYNYIPYSYGKRTLKKGATKNSEKFPDSFIHIQIRK